jgi:PhnB protein
MSNTTLEPYLFFGGRCDEAIQFYGSALDAKVEMVMRYNESPQPMPPGSIPPGFEKKVMHASLNIGGKRLMVSDGNEEGAKFEGFSLSLSYKTEAEVAKIFGALSAGGTVNMPLAKTFWSPKFGMVTDRLGVLWMISVEAQNP